MDDAAHTPLPHALDHVNIDGAAVRFVAHRKLSENVRHCGRIEQRLHDAAACLDQAADAVGEIVRQAVRLDCVLHHGQHPLLQLPACYVQSVVHGRHRETEERRNVLVRALVHEEKSRHLAQRVRQLSDRSERIRCFFTMLHDVIGSRCFTRHGLGVCQRHSIRLPSPEHAERLVPHDATQPARKCRGLSQARQP